ncbi:MAG: GUN4 domain-containing protein [Geitlerinemataceae cyanobacterium]
MIWLGITIALVVTVFGGLKMQRRRKSQQARDAREALAATVDAPLADRPIADIADRSADRSANPAPPELQPTEVQPTEAQQLETDYQYLQTLLDEQRYEEADRVTLRIFLQLANVEQRGYLELDDLDEIPAEGLRNLDRLWQACSGGRWGFARQAQIYAEHDCNYSDLGKEAGWMVNGIWMEPEYAIYDLDRAPDGHLPRELWRNLLNVFGTFGLSMCVDTFLVRESICDLPEAPDGARETEAYDAAEARDAG